MTKGGTLAQRVAVLEHDINGNGAKGMKEQFDDIERDLKSINKTAACAHHIFEKVNRLETEVRRINKTIYLAVGGAGVLVFVLEKIIKFL